MLLCYKNSEPCTSNCTVQIWVYHLAKRTCQFSCTSASAQGSVINILFNWHNLMNSFPSQRFGRWNKNTGVFLSKSQSREEEERSTQQLIELPPPAPPSLTLRQRESFTTGHYYMKCVWNKTMIWMFFLRYIYLFIGVCMVLFKCCFVFIPVLNPLTFLKMKKRICKAIWLMQWSR